MGEAGEGVSGHAAGTLGEWSVMGAMGEVEWDVTSGD
jgi:hypothetical protein